MKMLPEQGASDLHDGVDVHAEAHDRYPEVTNSLDVWFAPKLADELQLPSQCEGKRVH